MGAKAKAMSAGRSASCTTVLTIGGSQNRLENMYMATAARSPGTSTIIAGRTLFAVGLG